MWGQWRREPGRAPGQHNSLAPLPAYPSPRPRKTAKPEGPRGPGAPVDFPPFFKRMHYSPEMCLCVCRYSVVTIMPSVARPTFGVLGGPPPPQDYQNPGSPTDKILDPPRCFCFPPGPPRHPGPGALAPPAPPPSHRACVGGSTFLNKRSKFNKQKGLMYFNKLTKFSWNSASFLKF